MHTNYHHLSHGLDLSSRADTTHRQTHVDGRSNTFVEELSLQEDLSVSNRNDVCGNVSRDVSGLGLNHREGSEGSTTIVVVHLGSSLEETRVKVEHVTGVGLSAWGSSEQQGHLTVSYSLEEERCGKKLQTYFINIL